MHLAGVFAVAVADIDVGAGAGVEHVAEILRRHDQRAIAIDVVVADQAGRDIGGEFGFVRRIDQRQENFAEIDLGGGAEGGNDTGGHGAHALLDQLHGLALEDADRPAEGRRMGDHVIGVAAVDLRDAENDRIDRAGVARNDGLQRRGDLRCHDDRVDTRFRPGAMGAVAGDADIWLGNYNLNRFEKSANQTYILLRELAPYLWREGKTYPENPIRLAHLLADGEVDFAISYNPAEASKMIHDGLYPDTVRTFVFNEGTIANTHFVAIPFNAAHKEGAMAVANFLISPAAQLKKADPNVWGDFPAIDTTRLDQNWRKKFTKLPRGIATLSDEKLQSHQLPEPPSEILIRLEKGWDRHVLKGR